MTRMDRRKVEYGTSGSGHQMLQLFDTVPEAFFTTDPRELGRVFSGPTLLRIEGQSTNRRTVFVSTLLHGNETTGIRVLQKILRGARPDGPLWILIGNISAASAGVRSLAGQDDFNRVWRGEGLAAHPWAAELLAQVRQFPPLLALDIHNTTGRSIPYSAVSYLNAEHLFLASQFSKTVVHYQEPATTLSSALGAEIPNAVLEAGLSDTPEAEDAVEQYLRRVLTWTSLGTTSLADPQVRLLESHARIFVTGDFGFGGDEHELNLPLDLDLRNFLACPPGQDWGRFRKPGLLRVVNTKGHDVTQDYFSFEHGVIRNVVDFVPSLLTQQIEAVRKDCLGYVMRALSRSVIV